MSFEDNTVNGGGGRSIQRVKLVQQVKDKTQRLNELNGLTTNSRTHNLTED